MTATEVLGRELDQSGVRNGEIQSHCDICGDYYKGNLYAARRDYQVLACNRCKLIWASPLQYPATETTGDTYWAEETYLSNAEEQKQRFREQVKLFLKKSGIFDASGIRILEVGAGLGFFLDVCEEFGFAAEGCDISEKAIAYANRQRNRVRLGTLDSFYNNNSFDVVFAFNLIEHLPHPKEFLAEARRVLKPGGILVLETPIQESLFHLVARGGYLFSKGRLNFLGIDPGGHIYKFSKKTFSRICDDMGFENLYQKNIGSPFGEIWGESSNASFDNRLIYRLALPLFFSVAKLTGQGNRLFLLLRKR